MALDNAEFISELSITDPPGTDPLNQGDDHIRTTKKAVQQSFPNVDAAVPQTAAQMAQMAIKNEVNIFTQNNEFQTNQIFNSNITFELAGVRRGVIWNNSTVRAWDFQMNGATDNTLELRRYVGGVSTDVPIRFIGADGETQFPLTAVFQFIAQFNSTSARCKATNAGNETGLLYISDIATLRWGALMESTADGNSYAINRHDSNGLFQNQPFRIAGNGNIVMQRDSQRLSFLRDNGNEVIQQGALTDQSGFIQFRHGASAAVDCLVRCDNGGQTYILGDPAPTGTRRFGVGTNVPGRTLHVFKPVNSADLTPLRVTGLPTSSAGLVSGDCWNSSNFIAIIP